MHELAGLDLRLVSVARSAARRHLDVHGIARPGRPSTRHFAPAGFPGRASRITGRAAMSLETARRVLHIEAQAIREVLARLDESFVRTVDLLLACKGRVVVTGMGKSGLVARKISATLSSTGTPSFFLHPADAVHGDLGMLARGDAILAVSYGGETDEIVALLEALRRLEIPLVLLTGTINSTLGEASAAVLDVSVTEEACSLNLAPTASTTVAMAVGDAIAVSLLERRGFQPDDFAALHPAGRLGKKLLRVEHLMHAGAALPRVEVSAAMPEVFHEMSAKKLGMTTVTHSDGRLAGILTDGDLRRLMEKHRGAALELTAGQAMTRDPQTIAARTLASEALNVMEKRRITSIVVTDENGLVQGVVHLHDLWTLQLI
jgi:arabinose-5-phosphate isomerase